MTLFLLQQSWQYKDKYTVDLSVGFWSDWREHLLAITWAFVHAASLPVGEHVEERGLACPRGSHNGQQLSTLAHPRHWGNNSA